MDIDLNVLTHRYVMVWNVPDSDTRKREIRELFSPDIVHYTQSLEARGHAEMEQRIIGAHEKWVRDGGYRFEPLGGATGHHNIIRFRWQMMSAAGTPATTVGSIVLILSQDSRIMLDYQFIDQN